ncbi:Uncharacterised protein [BD1-7 clade bacterium]|uniref:Glycosyltransferase 2-like domain-containing protein n=1 Tax=BD1-7 clade bacterium TaxID=2029982 RepID=A0A5S9PMP5_9GAMM|nr:Uncharacterised protein [BD1-7 clade bacterium]CAA0105664.1 Uncharacterised protein [BD1-7 clade bacterium]
MKISIVIRTFGDSPYLGDVLEALSYQALADHDIETLVVGNGSCADVAKTAEQYGARVYEIRQCRLQGGRALNLACNEATGDLLVFLSSHCIPSSEHWLQRLIDPLVDGTAVYSYGRQLGSKQSEYSQIQHLMQYFPAESEIPQSGCFCNNANAALKRSAWKEYRFDDSLEALEDIRLAKELLERREKVAYVAEAAIYRVDQPDFEECLTRYAREAYALETIMPSIHFTLVDFARYYSSSVVQDIRNAFQGRCLHNNLYQILSYRLAQYWGAYLGHRRHRNHSNRAKHSYFNPDKQHKIR